MRKILLFDTAIDTGNLGDEIILESVIKELSTILDSASVYRMGTHIENYSPIQMIAHKFIKPDTKIRDINETVDYKFIGGTNLFLDNLHGIRPQFMLNLFNMSLYKNAVFVGVGRGSDFETVKDAYTRYLYTHSLSRNITHSVRDEETKKALEDMGFKAINTGCPTLWRFTEEFCKSIPKVKAKNVVCSVSGHIPQRDIKKDKQMIECLKSNYDKIYVWIQTAIDEEYFKTLTNQDNYQYKSIYSLNEFKRVLKNGDVDYIGTRLHGGIYALQNRVRSIIIAIDERANGFYESNNIPILQRKNMDSLDAIINREIITDIHLNKESIRYFLNQFN